MSNRRLSEQRDCGIIEQAVAELRRHGARIEEMLPAKITLHLPPKGSKDRVVLEIYTKLK